MASRHGVCASFYNNNNSYYLLTRLLNAKHCAKGIIYIVSHLPNMKLMSRENLSFLHGKRPKIIGLCTCLR